MNWVIDEVESWFVVGVLLFILGRYILNLIIFCKGRVVIVFYIIIDGIDIGLKIVGEYKFWCV